MLLKLSQAESDILHIRVARNVSFIDELDPVALKAEIAAGRYDICRLKINGQQEQLFNNLDELGIPYQVFAVNYHNIKAAQTPKPYDNDLYSYELCTPEREDLFKELVEKVTGTRSWPEYHSGLFRMFIEKQQERELAVNYFSSFMHHKRPEAYGYFIKYKDEYAGVFMGDAVGDTFYGTLYGILPEYRNLGLSKQIYEFMDHVCAELDLAWFKNDVSIFNIASQRSSVGRDLVPTEIYFNVILFPLLSGSGQPIGEQQVSPGRSVNKQLIRNLYDLTDGSDIGKLWFTEFAAVKNEAVCSYYRYENDKEKWTVGLVHEADILLAAVYVNHLNK